MESIVKPAVHRSDGQPNGKYRSQMTEETLKDKNSGRHWLVESFMSRLKRTTGTVLPARTKQSLFVEDAIRVLAYALLNQTTQATAACNKAMKNELPM